MVPHGIPGIHVFLGVWIGWVGYGFLLSGFGETKQHYTSKYLILLGVFSYSGSSIYLCFRATLTRNLELQ